MALKDLFSKKNTEEKPAPEEGALPEGGALSGEGALPEGASGETGYPVREVHEEEVKHEPLTPEQAQEVAPLYSDVILALKQVYDPEIPVNIYDLGLIYELYIDKDHNVFITMTFTAPNCPMADDVLQEVKTQVEDVPKVKSCTIKLVFEPVWDQSMLSDEAKIDLGLD